MPTSRFPIEEMEHGSRIAPRASPTRTISSCRAQRSAGRAVATRLAEPDTSPVECCVVRRASDLGDVCTYRYAPTHYSQVNQYLNGVYYIGSQIAEVSPWYILDGKLSRLTQGVCRGQAPGRSLRSQREAVRHCPCSSAIDYVFTDPPFGENIYYADLNFLVEAWHRVRTDATPEAIIDQPKKKGLHEYQELMRACFAEYFRVLKPGRWMTVVFSNSSNAVWRAIQEAMGVAGFVVADVRTLDKQQGSYRQVTSSAVKQDLVFPPTSRARPRNEFALGTTTEETRGPSCVSIWATCRSSSGEPARERSSPNAHRRCFTTDGRLPRAARLSVPLQRTAEFFAGLDAALS